MAKDHRVRLPAADGISDDFQVCLAQQKQTVRKMPDAFCPQFNLLQRLLSGRPEQASGSIVACSMEGTRPILLEIQALACYKPHRISHRPYSAQADSLHLSNLLPADLRQNYRSKPQLFRDITTCLMRRKYKENMWKTYKY